jgi:Putative Actinobacterial Holin-X, holin superfamily III
MSRNGHETGLAAGLQRGKEEVREVSSEFGSIASDLRTLGTMEMQLARAEVAEGVKGYGIATGIGATAALFAILMTVFLFLAVMFALDEVLPLWAAALITTGLLALLAGIFALLARKRFQSTSVVPRRAINSLQEDIRWARSQMNLSAR